MYMKDGIRLASAGMSKPDINCLANSGQESVAHPKQSNLAIQALFSVNAHMFSRLIDDRESLMPLLEMYRNLVSRIPGVGKDFGRQPSSLVADGAVALKAK